MSLKPRKALRILLPFTTATAIASLLLLAYSSWGGLIGVLIGLPLGVVIGVTGTWMGRRKKMRTARPHLERLLDAMIAMVEHPALPLEKIVFFNTSDRRKDGALQYCLCLHVETVSCLLATTTDRKKRIYVRASRYEKEKETQCVDYPELVGFATPEPWLQERLQRLRTLVGDVSGHKAMKKRVKELGIDLDKEDTSCGS